MRSGLQGPSTIVRGKANQHAQMLYRDGLEGLIFVRMAWRLNGGSMYRDLFSSQLPALQAQCV